MLQKLKIVSQNNYKKTQTIFTKAYKKFKKVCKKFTLAYKFIYQKGAAHKDRTSLIFLHHTAEQRILLSTDVSIPPNYWNKKRIAENLQSKQQTLFVRVCRYRKVLDQLSVLAKARNIPIDKVLIFIR